MIGLVIVGAVVAFGAALVAAAVAGGLVGNATGASVDSSSTDVPVSTTCPEAQAALEHIDQQIADLREEIEEAGRIYTRWVTFGVALTAAAGISGAIGVGLAIAAVGAGGAAIPAAIMTLIFAGALALAAAAVLGYADSWRARQQALTEELTTLGDLRLDLQDEVDRLCGTDTPDVPQVLDEPVYDVQ